MATLLKQCLLLETASFQAPLSLSSYLSHLPPFSTKGKFVDILLSCIQKEQGTHKDIRGLDKPLLNKCNYIHNINKDATENEKEGKNT